MNEYHNQLGQPIGFPIKGWQKRALPPRSTIVGKYCRIEPLDPSTHATELYDAYQEDKEQELWTYLPYGPFPSFDTYSEWLTHECMGDDPLFHTIIDLKTGKSVGVASYLRIEPITGVIEVGHINYSPQLRKTRSATEAMFLMMSRVFDELGYRRYEWKCDSLNARSCNAALRLGFVFEGIFRQAGIYKDRNRDTAWYSVIDTEWKALKKSFECWLDSENFDAQGNQAEHLLELINRTRNDKGLQRDRELPRGGSLPNHRACGFVSDGSADQGRPGTEF